MTKLEILRFAYDGALAAWAVQRERHEFCKSELSAFKLNQAWNKVDKIQKMIFEEEENK